MRGGGLGSRPKKMYGERLGDGVEYHLRRGVGFMRFLENGSRPQPPTSRINMCEMIYCYVLRASFVCVGGCARMCDMTHSFVSTDSFMYVT